MSEYEWEPRRVPRPSRAEIHGSYQRRTHEIAQFVALEHPRESVAWVLRAGSPAKRRLPWVKRSRTAKPIPDTRVTPLDLHE